MRWIAVLMTMMLTSCATVVATGSAAGLFVYDGRSFAMAERDARITYWIHSAMAADPYFTHAHISATSFHQMVLLAGQTPTPALREEINRIAKATPHVERVYDEITIGQPLSLAKRAQDSWITGKIRTRLLTCRGLASGSIRIVTEAGRVYLMGVVSHKQADLAVHEARQVRGVRGVVKVFRYV